MDKARVVEASERISHPLLLLFGQIMSIAAAVCGSGWGPQWGWPKLGSIGFGRFFGRGVSFHLSAETEHAMVPILLHFARYG